MRRWLRRVLFLLGLLRLWRRRVEVRGRDRDRDKEGRGRRRVGRGSDEGAVVFGCVDGFGLGVG